MQTRAPHLSPPRRTLLWLSMPKVSFAKSSRAAQTGSPVGHKAGLARPGPTSSRRKAGQKLRKCCAKPRPESLTLAGGILTSSASRTKKFRSCFHLCVLARRARWWPLAATFARWPPCRHAWWKPSSLWNATTFGFVASRGSSACSLTLCTTLFYSLAQGLIRLSKPTAQVGSTFRKIASPLLARPLKPSCPTEQARRCTTPFNRLQARADPPKSVCDL